MISKKINKFIQIAIENSNLEKKEFSQLNGKNIFINLQNTQTILYIKVVNSTIELHKIIESDPDLVLEGSPIAFLNYIKNINTNHTIKISGNASLADSFSNLLSKIEINWEQIIAEYINDDAAFYSSKFFSLLKNKANEVEDSLFRNLKEYIDDETDIIPSKDSINKYVKDVDLLRNKIEVMDVKLNKLK